MENLVLTPQQLKDLLSFVNDIPTKYGMPIMNFIADIIQQQSKKEENEEVNK